MKKFISGILGGVFLFAFNLNDNTTVAYINGKPIKVKSVNYYLQGITGDKNAKLQNLPKTYIPQIIKQYIETQIFYNKAKVVEKEPQFKELNKKVVVTYWLAEKLRNIKVSTREAKEFYETYKDIYFKQPEKFKARHILLKDEALAKKLISQLRDLKGEFLKAKFIELAKKYSIGPSASNGGELGWFSAKEMVPAFVNACKELKVGKISLQPVKTRYGYHLILLEDKKEAGYARFEDVLPKIVDVLKREKLQKELLKIKKENKIKEIL
jgi:parvulin-like peptidyl-prolyl isomerase